MYELNRLFSVNHTKVFLFTATDGSTRGVKDYTVRTVLDSAEQLGILTSKTKIVEQANGIGGIALASEAVRRGYSLTIVASEDLDSQIQDQLKRLGTTVILTPSRFGIAGALDTVQRISQQDVNVWTPNLFESTANPAAHETITGPKLWSQTAPQIDAFVCAVGSGGTFTGISRYLKRQKPEIRLIAVEPTESPVLSGGKEGRHGITGIGVGFVPPIFDLSLPSEIETVTTEEAVSFTTLLAKTEGILAGVSTGANLAVCARLVSLPEYQGKSIATIAFNLNM